MTKKFVLALLLVVASYPLSYAGDPDTGYGTIIAIEFMVDHRSYSPPIIGHLEYTGLSIDIVSFFEGIAGIGVLPQAQVYVVTEKEISEKGLHHVIGKNQYGKMVSGTIDFRDQLRPKVNLITDSGVIITNISVEGEKWKEKNIPGIVLGQ